MPALLWGKGDLLFVSFLLLLVAFFFFLEVQRNKEKKSLPTFLQETKFPRKVRYGSLSTGIGSELQKESFFPLRFDFIHEKKKSMKLVLKKAGTGLGRGQELPKT